MDKVKIEYQQGCGYSIEINEQKISLVGCHKIEVEAYDPMKPPQIILTYFDKEKMNGL